MPGEPTPPALARRGGPTEPATARAQVWPDLEGALRQDPVRERPLQRAWPQREELPGARRRCGEPPLENSATAVPSRRGPVRHRQKAGGGGLRRCEEVVVVGHHVPRELWVESVHGEKLSPSGLALTPPRDSCQNLSAPPPLSWHHPSPWRVRNLLLYAADPARSAAFYERLLQRKPAASFPTYAAFELDVGLTLGLWSTTSFMHAGGRPA
jgi:hypothetical protein